MKEMTRVTDNSIRSEPSPNVTVAISMAVYGMAMGSVMLLIGLYRYGTKPSLGQFLLSPGGILCVVAVLGFIIAGGVLVRFICGSQGRSRDRVNAVIMSLLIIVLVGALSEATLRIATQNMSTRERQLSHRATELLGGVHTQGGTYVANFHLLPRQWREYADRNRTVLARASQLKPFIVGDDTLGWTVGPNRKSEHGLYESSVEGLRSATQGEVLRKGLGDCRVALVGDSFTFGEDVRFEDSWGYRLEQLLPKGCRVLNFGVGAYGIGQMYLRYMRDVRSWKPDLVILSFIDHDVYRTMSVYGFLMLPDSDWPFVIPRFVLDQGDKLNIVNRPLPKAEEIFLYPYIHELPFIEYDWAYRRTEWDRPLWYYVHRSYLMRFLTSIYPLHEKDRPFVSDGDMHAVNQSLLTSFVDAVRKDRAIPLLVYLPAKANYGTPPTRIPEGLKILKNAKLEYVDLTSCVGRVAEPDRFIALGVGMGGGHYTPQANAAVAVCLGPTVQGLVRPAMK